MEGEASGTCPCLLNKGYPLRYADRDRRPPPIGVSNRQGVCTAWKADGSRKGIGVGYLLLRQSAYHDGINVGTIGFRYTYGRKTDRINGWLSRAASVLASKAKGTFKVW